jgi:hypothetical protein
MREKRIALFILMIGIGVGLGLLYGWVLNPVKYADTTPDMLHPNYKADYVLMVAEVYHADQNLDRAAHQIALLGSLPPAQIAANALITAKGLGYPSEDLDRMDELSQALLKSAPTPAPGSNQ